MREHGIYMIFGALGGAITSLLGGWNEAVTTLLIFMIIDYITGIVVAAVFNKSKHTENGRLASEKMIQGIFKKVMSIFIVVIASRLDATLHTNIIRDATVIAYIVAEGLSITENAVLMGVPVPEVIRKSIEVVKGKEVDK